MMNAVVGLTVALLPILVHGDPLQRLYVGCYQAKALTEHREHSADMTNRKCLEICWNWAYDYAGTQATNVCRCGNDHDAYGRATTCNMPCAGDSTKTCGGPMAISVYSTKPITPAPPPRECKTTRQGKEYTGVKDKTITGRSCQAWDSQSPHRHSRTPANYPNGHLEDAVNYCRNPDGEPNGPWCYTTDLFKRWEYCDVPFCPDPTPPPPPVPGVTCKTTQRGREYTGTVNVTKYGLKCQAWASQDPHKHNRTPANFPNGHLENASNYCRNPDNEPFGPWCYTTSPGLRWQYCDIPMC